MKILIVDDNRDDRQLLKYMVERHGHQAVEAENGQEGLEKAREFRPELIISDALMPQMDGFQFLWELKKDPDLRLIPFVFYSASYRENDDIRLAKSMGANDYLIKPLDLAVVWEKIAKIINDKTPVSKVASELPEEDAQFLKHYSRLVADKLEKKVRELEQSLEERRRAEETLRESQNFIRTILDSVDEGFIVVDREYRVLSANRAFCEMAKLSADEVKGKLCHELLHGAARSCSERGRECPVRHTFTSKKPHATLHVFENRGGTKSYLELKSYPILDDANEVVSVIETINDVTEKHKLEEQLQQVQKLESVGQLAGGVAHDFNNMLAVILGRTQMAMMKTSPDNPLYANLQEIRKSAERSADLTRQLLAFARKQVITPQVIDLNETVEGMLKMLRRLIGEDIDLAWLPDTVELPVNMDPVQLDQILANLCVNARDAVTNAGKITIEARQVAIGADFCADHLECYPGEYALLTVSDNGQGMDKAILDRIFEPFFTTKGIGQGTGLGLSTVYGIVKQNGGLINAYSEPGYGTTFKIYLPLHTEKAAQPIPNSLATQPPRGDETILLVEDEAGILIMAQQMLEECGYRVIAANSPDEAIRAAAEEANRIDLLITDVVMPEMNGRELEKRLTAERPIKCLYMSGYPSDVILRHGILEEGVHFIQKPFSLEALAAKVRQALSD